MGKVLKAVRRWWRWRRELRGLRPTAMERRGVWFEGCVALPPTVYCFPPGEDGEGPVTLAFRDGPMPLGFRIED